MWLNVPPCAAMFYGRCALDRNITFRRNPLKSLYFRFGGPGWGNIWGNIQPISLRLQEQRLLLVVGRALGHGFT